ncbi:AraC family transcriptional regulator [Chondrinema litorale]|uniref:AraC family transcriptional regulator n=1 Tax=Chondrinema litorale TaxID=2994555 RepID=UPI002543A40A|nr:helix-turn-helix transcriptional regulator [Chondrinema litorale]UZR96628.1 helix-turn-helix transcriptional regulator [Chondrinema litorale]
MERLSILDIKDFEYKEALKDFYCNNFSAHLELHHKDITIPHKHNFFLTVIFTKGNGIHEIDFERYEIKPGSVFMLNPGQTHYWELSSDIEGIIFFHSQEFFDLALTSQSIFEFPFFYSLLNPSVLNLEAKDAQRIYILFEQLLEEYSNRSFYTIQKIKSILNLIYIELSRKYLATTEVSKSNSGYLRKLETLIEANYKVEKLPTFYAEKLSITTRHLNRLVQQSLGKTTSQLIIERIILEAKRMIIYVSGSLSQISYELGYEDYAYFSRVFKKWTGETPLEFSEKYKSKSNT